MDTTKYDLEDVNPRRKNAIISQFGSFTCLRDQRSRSTSLSSAGSRSRKKSLPIDYLPTSNPFVIVKRKSSEPRKSIVDDTIKEEPVENDSDKNKNDNATTKAHHVNLDLFLFLSEKQYYAKMDPF